MKKKTLSILYSVFTAALGLGGAAWLLALLIKYYNAKTNGFTASGSTLTAVGIVLFVFVAGAFLLRWKIVGKIAQAKIMPKAVYGVLAMMFLLSGVLSVVRLLTSKQYISSTLFLTFALLSSSFSFVVALFFGLKLTRFEKKTEQFSLVVPVWMIFAIGSSYFNTTYTYASFTRAVLNLSMAAMLLFAMAEIREYLGRKHFILLSASSAAAIVLGSTSIVSRYAYIIASGAAFSFSDCQEIATFAMLVYVLLSSVYKNHSIENDPPAETEEQSVETPSETETPPDAEETE